MEELNFIVVCFVLFLLKLESSRNQHKDTKQIQTDKNLKNNKIDLIDLRMLEHHF